jgi:hypothetical protein
MIPNRASDPPTTNKPIKNNLTLTPSGACHAASLLAPFSQRFPLRGGRKKKNKKTHIPRSCPMDRKTFHLSKKGRRRDKRRALQGQEVMGEGKRGRGKKQGTGEGK